MKTTHTVHACWRTALAFAAALCGACSDTPAPPPVDASVDLGPVDASPFADRGPADSGADLPRDLAPDVLPCGSIGVADHCRACNDKCPGPDNAATSRVCISAQCGIECRGESYDANGQAGDGCEVEDAILSPTEQLAFSLGQSDDSDNAVTKTGLQLLSDDRLHLSSPTERKNGRTHYFKMQINDTLFGTLDAWAEVDLSALPTGATYELHGVYVCSNGKALSPATKTGPGGGKLRVDPADGCGSFALSNDDGTLFVRVTKLSGPHSAATYTLKIEP